MLPPSVVDDTLFVGDLTSVVDQCIVTSHPRRAFSSFPRRIPILWRLNRVWWKDDDMDRVCWPATVAAVKSAVRLYDPVVVRRSARATPS